MTRLIALLALSMLSALALAFPKQSGHGKNPEPITVMPLEVNLARDFAIHDGVVDGLLSPAKPALSVRVTRLEQHGVTIELRNLGEQTIKLQLFQVMQDGRFSPSKSCPIGPGKHSFEVWPEAFDALGFGVVEVLPDNAQYACD